MNKVSFVLLLLIYSLSLPAQVNRDSLLNVWNNEAVSDADRCKAVSELLTSYQLSSPDTAHLYGQQMREFARNKGLTHQEGEAYYLQGLVHYAAGEHAPAALMYKKAVPFFLQVDSVSSVVNALMKAGHAHRYHGEADSATACYERAVTIAQTKAPKSEAMARSLYSLGVNYSHNWQNDPKKHRLILKQSLALCAEQGYRELEAIIAFALSHSYKNEGRYDQGIIYAALNLAIRRELNDKQQICYALNNMGGIYMNSEDMEKAREFLFESLEVANELGDLVGQGNASINIGYTYMHNGDTALAFQYYREGMRITDSIGNLTSKAVLLINMTSLYFDYEEYDKAMELAQECLIIATTLENKVNIAASHSHIANVYFVRGRYREAIRHGEIGLKIAKEINNLEHMHDLTYHLSEVYKKTGKYKSALEMHKLYISIRDTLENKANQEAMIRNGLEYSFQKETDSLANVQLLKDELAAADVQKTADLQQKENEKNNLIFTLGAIGLGLILLFSLFIVNRLRITRRQKTTIEMQKREVEVQKQEVDEAHAQLHEKNTEIIDSINYAKRLQNAMLPPTASIAEFLPKHFVFFQPKDVVSGDFYWFQHLNGTSYLASADCTGHGVPGAMVSVVCNNALNRAVLEYGLTEPGQILDKTREIVIREFGVSGEAVRDGMDIALVSLKLVNGQHRLRYAGAYNPLWVIRNGSNTVEETKAHKQPIGEYDQQAPFPTHEFELQKGDAFYLFSDGFQDQFGGPKGKKFKPIALKNLFLSIKGLRLDEQRKAIQTALSEWTGDLEQLDDVCVLGVRI